MEWKGIQFVFYVVDFYDKMCSLKSRKRVLCDAAFIQYAIKIIDVIIK